MKIAHATKNENGQMWGGQPGDQTGKEVCVQEFVEYDWDWVFRPKNKVLAKKIATYAVIIAENDAIGYGNEGDDRYTFYLEAKALGWDFTAVTTPCNTDCSQLVATICIASGLNVNPFMYTISEKECLDATGVFEDLTYKEGMKLEPGDIILTVRNRHTAIIVSADETDKNPKWVGECYGAKLVPVYSEPRTDAPRCTWPTLATGNLFDVCGEDGNWYYIRIAGANWGWIEKQYVLRKTPAFKGKVSTSLYVRTNPGASYPKVGVLSEGQIIDICDTKKAANQADWYYIKLKDGFGFCSARYVKKV